MTGCMVRVPHRVDEVIEKEYDIVPCSECRHSDEVPEGDVLVCDKLPRRVRHDGGDGCCPFGSRRKEEEAR